jgi:aquaporin Z
MDKRRLAAEVFGTFWLVLGGCGTAVLAGSKVGFLGIAFAFGLTVLTMAYAVGHISGGHFNPAVTVGLVVAGRFDSKDALPYIVSQVVGAILGAIVLAGIATGIDGFKFSDGFAANGWGTHGANHFYSLLAVVIAEVVLTAFFLIVILGATAKNAFGAAGGLAIGLALTLIHLISIPVSNTSVNPARSTSQALFAGGDYLKQLPVFWVAPIVGAALGGLVWKVLLDDPTDVDLAHEPA